jgi:hypothetical protein
LGTITFSASSGSQFDEDGAILLLRKRFLSDGVRESRVLQGAVKQGASGLVLIDRILHQWVGCGHSAGVPEIGDRAQIMRDLASCKDPDIAALTLEARALGKLFGDTLAGLA